MRHSTLTSAHGDLRMTEVRHLGVWWFYEVNEQRPSSTLRVFHRSYGLRIGSFRLALTTSWRVWHDSQALPWLVTHKERGSF
jgi:hypothetical protein